VGGTTERRSKLTPLARELVRDFVNLRQTMIDRANAEFAKRFSTLQ
jgi:molybdenum-dependent DNA-binding transcriptional regulator ModE